MNAILKKGTEIDRAAWLVFLTHSPQTAVYMHPGYLDVVAPGWSAIEVWRDRTLLAIMPLYLKQKGGYTYSLQPSFCQYWGIVFAGGDLGNAYKTYSHRRKVVKAVVDAIPAEIKWFLHGFAPEFDYPHPFHWAGYGLKTRYTYRLDLKAGYEAVEKDFGNDTKYDMRKAVSAGVSVRGSGLGLGSSLAYNSGECNFSLELMRLVKANVAEGKQMLTAPETVTLSRLVDFLVNAGLGYVLEATDAGGAVVGAGLFGSFAGKTCYLMSAQLPGASGSGAMSLLLAQALRQACEAGQIFDFEGSMIEGIEGFFRGFGGHPVPYLMIEKNDLPLPIRWIRKLR
jgi:hypothetical protein